MPKKLPVHKSKATTNRMNKYMANLNSSKSEVRRFRSSGAWTKFREMFRKDNPLCYDPFGDHESDGRVVPSQEVHHIVSVANGYMSALDADNCAALCSRCHQKIERMNRIGSDTKDLFKGRAPFVSSGTP